MTTELNILAIDQDDPGQIKAALAALAGSGAVFRTPDHQLMVTSEGTKIGHLYARRIRPKDLMATMHGRGALRFVSDNGRGPQSVPLWKQQPYTKWLGTILEQPTNQVAFQLVEGAYNLPAVVIDRGAILEAWHGNHHGRLFTGAMLPPGQCGSGYPHLRAWLSDIQFLTETYRANLMGWILATLARPMCNAFPFLLLDGVSRKVGKTTVADAIGYFITGSDVSPITHTGDETEFEKRVAKDVGQPGPNVVFVDNVRPKRGQQRTIRSQFLAAASTNPCPSVRQNYGRRPERLDYPIIMFTMNGSAVEHDLHDRTVRVLLTAPGRYFDPHPLRYVQAHRAELLCEAMTLLTNIRVDGAFTPTARFGVFEVIATRAAAALGYTTNFDPDAVDTGDAVVKELAVTLADLELEKGKQHATFTDLAGRVQMHADSLPELSAVVKTARTSSVRGQAAAIREVVEALAQRSLNVDGKSVRFVISKDTSNQYVVTLESS